MTANRHLVQVKPRNTDGPPYSPQRDLAYIYAPAMKEAVHALDQVNWSDEIKTICEKTGVTEDDISQAVGKLTDAHLLMVNDPTVSAPVDALNNVGWYETNPAARYLIYGRLGEVLLGGFFLALRDVSAYGEESAQSREIADFVAAGRMVLERGSGVAQEQPDAENLMETKHRLTAELVQSRKANEALKNLMLDTQNMGERKHRDTLEQFRGRAEALTRENASVRETLAAIDYDVSHMGWWDSLKFLFMNPGARHEWIKDRATRAKSQKKSDS